MDDIQINIIDAMHQLSQQQILQAGNRYTPGLDPDAPNIKINSLLSAIDGVACGQEARKRFQQFLNDFSEAWVSVREASQSARLVDELIVLAQKSLDGLISGLRMQDSKVADDWTQRLFQIELAIQKDLSYWREAEAKLPERSSHDYSKEDRKVRENVSEFATCFSIVREEKGFCESPEFRVHANPHLLLTGEWGTGKTHLICDLTRERIIRGQPTIMVLSKNFEGDILSQISHRILPNSQIDLICEQLQVESEKTGERALIIFDGVNEGNRKDWKTAISEILKAIKNFPGIGLIVTCRKPFEDIAISVGDREQFHEISHYGFDDEEFDAQAVFFKYYDLPLPEIPLLDEEFSRPLTLKLICQAFKDLKGSKVEKGFAGIASGQRGMTFVLESFVVGLGKQIEQQFGLNPKDCWVLLKGKKGIQNKKTSGFAPCMAMSMRGYVRPSEADQIIAANHPTFSPSKRRKLLESLRVNGILEEDIVWYQSKTGSKSRIVFRLPYQRFSDHLVARHLLEAYLDVTSVKSIEQSFSSGSPLSKVFKVNNRYWSEYAEPGWAQALIAEFPERVGKRLPENRRELFHVLPKKSRKLSAYFDPFVEGMFWRAPTTFSEGTNLLISAYLSQNDRIWARIIDALAAVSTKPKHPYHASRLYNFLAKFSMSDRDRKWSEYLRNRYSSPTIHRLLTWAEQFDQVKMSRDVAKELIVLFSLILTTVVRRDRDLATKALVQIGERYPDLLFEFVIPSLSFNDPYVSERVLAAAYGVTMSLVDADSVEKFHPLLSSLAENLYQEMFSENAKFGTHHTLKRDYAAGIIELAVRAKCIELSEKAVVNMSPPYPCISTTFSDKTPDEEAIKDVIHMDFGNYTIGRLIPSRANYDDKNPEYLKVKSQIEGRIYDLGYRSADFGSIDRDIGRDSYRMSDENKIDRYGKKYSWIAYFEMWGEKEARKELKEWRLKERTSDCGVDPSFPKKPPEWSPPIPDLFGDMPEKVGNWVSGGYTPNWDSILVTPEINSHLGPWVLVDGYINGTCENTDREIFTFLTGLFIARKDVDKLRTEFISAEYPGNRQLPEGAEEYYLYAGEAGRRNRYAAHLLRSDGTYRRQTGSAFDKFVEVPNQKLDKKNQIKEIVIKSFDGVDDKEIRFSVPNYPITKRQPGIRVEIPSITYSWESYHSKLNSFSGFYIPAPSIIEKLGLVTKNREIDFYDEKGDLATAYRTSGKSRNETSHKLLYIRADLLQKYLKQTRQKLVWCNWGERDWLKKMEGHELIENAERSKLFQSHQHIHRSFIDWNKEADS